MWLSWSHHGAFVATGGKGADIAYAHDFAYVSLNVSIAYAHDFAYVSLNVSEIVQLKHAYVYERRHDVM